jgi:hypothetical protein
MSDVRPGAPDVPDAPGAAPSYHAADAPGAPGSPIRVALEIGARRVFATALDWPGWCRGGKSEIGAIDALLDTAPRYALVLARAGLQLPDRPVPDVIERLAGGAGTDFGAPGVPAADERRATTAAEGARRADILLACWAAFDAIADASPEVLRKGPRGGGRDRSRIVEHVVEAERGAYARKIGVRHAPFAPDDRAARDALRADMLAVLRAPSDGAPPIEKGWPARFAARYIAWHVLDHAWEIEDRRM